MSQISISEAQDLIHKLLTERIPLRTFFVSGNGVEVALPGFVDSLVKGNLSISVSGPPLDNSKGWMRIPFTGRNGSCWYGDSRELPEEFKMAFETPVDSVLRFDFADSGDILAIFFAT